MSSKMIKGHLRSFHDISFKVTVYSRVKLLRPLKIWELKANFTRKKHQTFPISEIKLIFLPFSPLTSNSPAPILEQTWVTRSEAPTTNVPVPTALPKEYSALTISHSAPASHQASFERGESVERTRPQVPGPTSGNNNNR